MTAFRPVDRFLDIDREAAVSYLSGADSRTSIFDKSGIQEVYENELAAFHGRKYCLLMSSGTAALYSAFFCLDLKKNDNVVGPAVTFMTTVTPAALLGARLRLVDCDADTCNIVAEKIGSAIDERTRAIVYTNMFGLPCDIDALRAIAQQRGLPLIEDNSLSVGAYKDGQLTGSYADLTCFSLGSTKLFSGGQGGALLTDRSSYLDRALLLGHFGRRAQLQCSTLESRSHAYCGYGLNFRMHVLAAAISRNRFAHREELFSARRARYQIVAERLQDFDFLRVPGEDARLFRGSWQGYVVRLAEPSLRLRAQLIKALAELGPFAKYGLYYPSLPQLLSLYRKKIDLPESLTGTENAERFSFCVAPMLFEPLDLVERAADMLRESIKRAVA